MHKRREFLKTGLAASLSTLAFPALGANVGRHKRKATEDIILGHDDYQYRVIRDWAQLSTVHNPLLNCHEMVMDRQGRLIMIGDHTANNNLPDLSKIKILYHWGTAYPGGHGLSISEEGEEDFLYLTDSVWYMTKNGKWIKQNG
ncbi:MAG: 6-bladed beta-propeller, partial [Bacteroidota bacterium]